MNNIIKYYFRNKKLNTIHISLLLIIIIVIVSFQIIYNYFDYNTNFIYGKLEENRGYTIYTNDKETLQKIQDNFIIEKTECTNTECYIVLKKYKDTEKWIEYLKNEKINFNLTDSSHREEIELIRKNRITFAILQIFSIGVVFIIMSNIIESIFYNERKNLAIYKTLGYKNKTISKIFLVKLLLLFLISAIISYLFLIILKASAYCFQNEILVEFFKVTNMAKINSLGTLIGIIILFLNYIPYRKKIKKMNVFTILEN